MKILLDECVPRPIRRLLPDHEVVTVQEACWAGIENGNLLRRAEGQFQAFITADKNLRYQQKLASRKIAIIELPTPDWFILKNLGRTLNEALKALTPEKNYIEIQLPGN